MSKRARSKTLVKENEVLHRQISEVEEFTEQTKGNNNGYDESTVFRSLFQNAPDAIMLIDPHDAQISWPIIDCNQAACDMNGYKRDEIIGYSIDKLDKKIETRIERAKFIDDLRQQEVNIHETYHKRKDGQIILIECTNRLIVCDGRELLIGIDRDITQIRSAQSRAQIEHERTKALMAATDVLFQSIEINFESLQDMLDIIHDVVPYDSANLMIADTDSVEILITKGYSYEEQAEAKKLRYPISKFPILQSIARTKTFCRIPDVTQCEDWIGPIVVSGIRSYIGFPLVFEDEVRGFLNLHSNQLNIFTSNDENFLLTFSKYAAAAVNNSRLYRKIDYERRLLQILLDHSPDSIYFKDTSSKYLRVSRQYLNLLGREDVNDVIGKTDDELFSSDYAYETREIEEALFNESKAKLNLEREIPTASGHTVWVSEHKIPCHTENDTDVGLVGIARDINRHVQDLEIINNVAELMSRQIDTKELFKTIVSKVREKLNCTHCTLFLIETEADSSTGEEHEYLVPKECDGEFRELIMQRRFLPNSGIVGWVYQQGRSIKLDDAKTHPNFAPSRRRKEMPRSMIVSPVITGDQCIGVISADKDEYSGFSVADRRLLDALARHAGIAISRANARTILVEIGSRLIGAALNLDTTLHEIVAGATRLVKAKTGVIFLFDDAEPPQEIIKAYHYPVQYVHPRPRMTHEEGLTRTIIKTQKELIITDISSNEQAPPILNTYYKSMIGLPLVSEGKVIGVLYVHDDTSHSFNETEVSLLYNVVNLAVIAIKRASSIKELQELNKILENNNSMLSRINDELKTTSPDVVELIGASDGEVWDITKKIIERSLPGREFALYIHNRETQNCDLFAATQGLDGQLLRFWSRDERNSPLDPPTRETYFYCKQLRNSYGGLEGALILSKLKNADMTELQHENTIFYILLPALAQALYMNAFE